jgi:hypothetical protein
MILAVFVMSTMANAKQVGKVALPDSLMAGKDELLLNGAGFRKKFFIKMYAGGLKSLIAMSLWHLDCTLYPV